MVCVDISDEIDVLLVVEVRVGGGRNLAINEVMFAVSGVEVGSAIPLMSWFMFFGEIRGFSCTCPLISARESSVARCSSSSEMGFTPCTNS